ncbi:MAG: EAL domain-containing protein [Gammaproteobacteria bacterium]|nr:EAL domain-containing protein [Gammaproteobacteria bacterium]
MTLSRQLIILIASLVLLLFMGTLAISVNSMRAYLESQLASHAQDSATSLGLSATAHVDNGDQAMVTAMINAMFHRGDYLLIRFEDLDGKAWLERSTDVLVDDVPAWFMRAFPLDPPQRSATMMSGWRQVGRVIVTSHPGLAYSQLWQNTLQTLKLFLIGAALALFASVIGLRFLLRPLREVELQAEAICNREFPVVERRPFTLELRRVVEAMNRLSARVSRMLSDSETLAAELRSQAYQDPVTGLANRRQFMQVLAHRTSDRELFASGGLMLLELNGFKAYNQEHGYTAGDELLRHTGNAISSSLVDEPRSTVAHLAGADFAVLIESVDGKRLRELAERVRAAVAGLTNQLALASPDIAHIGAAEFSGQDATSWLADADMALREAQREGANAVVVRGRADTPTATRSRSEWRSVIETALSRGHFSLLRQPVVAVGDDRVLHHEVFLRIDSPDTPGQSLAAAVFMPMAEGGGLADKVDRAVISEVIRTIEGGQYPERVAVNLSPSTLAAGGMLDWLTDQLHGKPTAAARLILELPEYGAASYMEPLREWIARLSPLGVQFSLDHFGKGFSAFAYLRNSKVDYLKIDGSLVRELAADDDNRFLLRTIIEIGHGLDMKVIAEAVETESEWQLLRSLGVDGGRGYWLGAPE